MLTICGRDARNQLLVSRTLKTQKDTYRASGPADVALPPSDGVLGGAFRWREQREEGVMRARRKQSRLKSCRQAIISIGYEYTRWESSVLTMEVDVQFLQALQVVFRKSVGQPADEGVVDSWKEDSVDMSTKSFAESGSPEELRAHPR